MPLAVFDALDNPQESRISPLHLVQTPEMFETLLSLDSSFPLDSEDTTAYKPLLLWHVKRRMEGRGIRTLIDHGALPTVSRPQKPRLPYHLYRREIFNPPWPFTYQPDYPFHQSPLEAAVHFLDERTTELLLLSGASSEYLILDGQNRTSLHCTVLDHIFMAPERNTEEARATLDVCLRDGMDPNLTYGIWLEIPGTNRRRFSAQSENLLSQPIFLDCDISMLIMLSKAGANPELPLVTLGHFHHPAIGCLDACLSCVPELSVDDTRLAAQMCEKLAVIARARDFTETTQFMLQHVVGHFALNQMLPAFQAIGHVTWDFHSGSTGSLLVELLERARNTPGTLYHSREAFEFLLKAQATIMDTHKCTAALGLALAVPMVSPLVSRDAMLQNEIDIPPSLLPYYRDWGASIDLAEVSRSPQMTAERVENGAAIMMALLSAVADFALCLDQDERTALQLASRRSWASIRAPSVRSVFAYMGQVAEAVTQNRPPPVGFTWDT